MVFEHAAPRAAKSALSIEGAMIAGGDIVTASLELFMCGASGRAQGGSLAREDFEVSWVS
jgi:hypothetical protein